MEVKMKKLLALFVFLTLCAAILSQALKRGSVPLPQNEPISVKRIESFVSNNIEEAAYNIGFNQGERAFMLQTLDPKAESINFKEEQYTVALDLSPEQKRIYDENVAKGYVDGYHKSSESLYCPGKTY